MVSYENIIFYCNLTNQSKRVQVMKLDYCYGDIIILML